MQRDRIKIKEKLSDIVDVPQPDRLNHLFLDKIYRFIDILKADVGLFDPKDISEIITKIVDAICTESPRREKEYTKYYTSIIRALTGMQKNLTPDNIKKIVNIVCAY